MDSRRMCDHRACFGIRVWCRIRRSRFCTRRCLNKHFRKDSCIRRSIHAKPPIHPSLQQCIQVCIQTQALKSIRACNRTCIYTYIHACMRLYKRKNHADTLHKPAQPVVPLLVHPDGQLPHVRPPGVLLHARLVSHPPFPFRHSSMSKHAFPQRCTHT